HFVTPSYSIAYTGPVWRGGASNNIENRLRDQIGQKYPKETRDLTHVFSLSFLKRDSDFISEKKIAENSAIFDYGLLASYRMQDMDSYYDNPKAEDKKLLLVKRNGHVGLGSLWTSLSYKTFHIEAEF